MKGRFEFEEEIDESAIAIDLDNIQTNNSIFYIVSKRIIDIVGSLAGIILLSPLFLVVEILIKIEDPKGKVFFSQERNGSDYYSHYYKEGRKFNKSKKKKRKKSAEAMA